uniref:Uncharacterized protein n=1 Tax=Lepeophtheirus salmonis TaxID=72036 RepID=A0A0K2TY76_LEPSM
MGQHPFGHSVPPGQSFTPSAK